MLKIYSTLILVITSIGIGFSQGNVGIGVATPNKNAVLELVSSGNNQGILIPKVTTAQRTAAGFTAALTSSENGLMVFDSDENVFYFWKANAWTAIGGTLSGTAGGDLTGTYPSPTLNNNTVTSATIVDGTITAADLSNLSIGDTKIANGLTVSKLTPGTNGQVLTTTAGAVTWGSVGAGTITNLSTGTGLIGGPITSSGTISLANTAVSAGSYGSTTTVPQINVDAQGRITSATSATIAGVAPGGAAGGDLTGTYPSPTLNSNTVTTTTIVDGTITTADVSNLAIVDSKIANGLTVGKLAPGTNGQVLTTTAGAVTWGPGSGGTITNISTGTGLIGGPITASGTISLANTAVTAGAYGSATAVPQIVVDGQGRITSATSTTIAGVSPGGAAGGDLTGTYPNPTINVGAITTGKILDGTIVNADISATAAIVSTKIAAGASGQVLTTSGGATLWANPSGSVLINNAGTRNLFAGEFVGGSSGSDNAFYGSSAGNGNTSGSYNAIFGTGAGQNKTVGDLNTFVGWIAGQGTGATASFNGNTFIGAQSGQNTTGGPNTFVGEKSGQTNTTGTQNLFAGNRAGLVNTTGTQNTILGYYADLSTANLQNATAIGYNTIVNASNKVRVGNTVVTVIEGQVPFTSASDQRFKTGIAALGSGLDFIMKLNPVSYRMKNSTDTKINWGFIAQEIQSLVGSENAMVTVGADKEKTLGLRYTDFVAPLVKSVQEQQVEITTLKEALLKKDLQIKLLEDQVEKIRKSLGL